MQNGMREAAEIRAAKERLRLKIRQMSAGLDAAACRQADRAIARRIISMEEYRRAQTVFCFVSTAREIDTAPVLRDVLAAGKRLGVPRCLGPGEMEVFAITDLGRLERGSYGILEPPSDAPRIGPEEIDFAVLPCLAADRSGRRLGHGGGYYDRYLARMRAGRPADPAFTALICRGVFLQEEVPAQEHDERASAVVWEGGIYSSILLKPNEIC